MSGDGPGGRLQRWIITATGSALGAPHESEAALPTRRHLFQAVGGVNLLFLLYDVRQPAPHWWVVIATRVLISVWLLGPPALLARHLSPRRGLGVLRAQAVLIGLTFGALVWGSGGSASPYLWFYGFVPLVLAIGVPDDPVSVGLCGVTVWLVGPLALGQGLVFWSLATGSVTFYAVTGTVLHLVDLQRRLAQQIEAERLARRLDDLERRRALDDRLALLGRMVAEVAHELKNPLTYVSANISLLRETAEGRASDEALADVELGLSRISGLVDDLRTFARDEPEPEPIAPCALGPVVDEAVRVSGVRLASLAKVEQHLAADLPLVVGSPRRLVQVLVNLLVNAADALEGRPAPRRVRLSAQAEGAQVLLTVEDSGAGIAPEVRERLFTPFVTTKGTKGTGLGLALSQDYLVKCGGRIEVGQSELGGARFTVRLARAG